MPSRTAPTPVRRAVCLLLATTFLSACYSWSVPDRPAGDYLQREGPAEVRVDRGGSSDELRLHHATVQGDSVVGIDGDGSRVAVPLSEVEGLQARRTDGGKTALLVGGIAAGTAALIYVIAASVAVSKVYTLGQ
ncbi:MAG TPA: hypothetical protein VKB18_01290 [Gemmatimonadota bacterium]|nr:hypothetical protein [Gemmatimonadota bacterium]